MDASMERPTLDGVEQRVLGSLLEKERTVPASYPMTLNGLRTACNQSSGRDPILDLVEAEVQGALDALKARGLVRFVHAAQGARVVKHRQVLDERLELDGGERAVLTVLLLRGAQTPGELRSRSERLHAFRELTGVEQALASLAARSEPLVQELERRPGQKEARWIHLLGPVAVHDVGGAAPAPATAVGPDPAVTEAVLAAGPAARDAKVVAAYDEVAGSYADHLLDELDRKPFDRWLLERVADLAEGGPVADAGCGPGQVTFHLAAAGADVRGFDLSPGMVAEASRRFPELGFAVGDLTALPAPAGGAAGWAAVTAWYSLVHLAGSELPPAVALLTAALRPGGWLAFALHLGSEVRHFDDWWDHAVDVDFTLHAADQVLRAVATAGLVEVEWYRRSPIAGAEVETERLYVLARRPG
ncbi:DUF480 domain-containing protein [Aquihabitans sp. G128]|uniref:DUF480 domain-containing protein n=1 Tax=Aquihabitans sp. G128 TaxID=2849779 RepID=UPI001C235D3E|nr:DUF480 domain-containing protein [Aquihabitans sp. G128]QXC59773.1 DUF480 domain-containing protein [Aquihabitans sp. G128]